MVHHPLINKYVQILKNGIIKIGISPYNNRSGQLRYVQFDIVENQVIVALVINADVIDNQIKELVDFLVEKGVNSLWINFNKRLDNVIFGPRWTQVWGEPYFWRTIAGTPIATTPASFSQANPALFGALVASLRDEPTSALNPGLTLQVVDHIERLKQENKIILIATHDLHLLEHLDGQLFLMEKGSLVESAPKKNWMDQPNLYPKLQHFLGKHR